MIEQIINNLEQKYLNFELGEEQKSVLLSIFHFIQDEIEMQCSLVGSAGTGKTSLTKLIIRYLEQINKTYVIAAPTHKAKRVIAQSTERDVITLHQLLVLKPTLDILDLDFKDLQFNSDTIDNGIPKNGILLIDEASMINETLFDYINQSCNTKNCKIIWILDECQLQPIKDKKLSKATNIHLVYKLNKIYRQKDDNPILDVLVELRNNYKTQFKEIISNKGDLILYANWKEFLDNNIDQFKEVITQEDPNIIKLLAYTNKRVNIFNEKIRERLFENSNEYNIGDILMAYDSCEVKDVFSSHKLYNSNDYIVKNVTSTIKMIYGIQTKGYVLELFSIYEGFTFDVYILSLENDENVFQSLAALIEMIRIDAIRCKNKRERNKIWVQYFQIMGSFLTPIDISYQGRIIRSKSLGYGYALSVHRSQGSSFDNVLIDMGNIMHCPNNAELRQLQYVSMSRTRKNIHMLI